MKTAFRITVSNTMKGVNPYVVKTAYGITVSNTMKGGPYVVKTAYGITVSNNMNKGSLNNYVMPRNWTDLGDRHGHCRVPSSQKGTLRLETRLNIRY